MPTYEYRCACGHREDAVRTIAERDNAPLHCGKATERRITATMVSVFSPYRAVAVDKESGERPMIRSKAEHQAFLSRNGYEEVGNDRSMAPRTGNQIAEHRAQKEREAREAEKQPIFDLNEFTHDAQLPAQEARP